MTRRATSVLAVAALAAVSCSSGVHPVKKDLAALRQTLVAGEYSDLWKGLSASRRAEVDAEAFASMLAKDPEAMEALLAVIDQALENSKITYKARLRLEDGTEVVLVLEGGTWVVETPVTVFYAQSTPREALASFIKAFKARRWDVIAELMPSKYEAEDDAALIEKSWGEPSGREEIERLVKVLEDHMGDAIDVQGNAATLRYPDGQVTFLREAGRWVILDLD